MIIPLKLRIVQSEHPDLSRRAHAEIMRASTQAIGTVWATQLLPQHFGAGAGAQFGYKPRKPKYLRIKQRQFNHGTLVKGFRIIGGAADDLIYTGRLRARLLTSAAANIAAFPSRVTIKLVAAGLPYFTLRARSGHTQRIADEVLRDSQRHLRILEDVGRSAYDKKLREVRASGRLRKTITIG